MERRTFLATVGVATGVAVAGCGAAIEEEVVVVGPGGNTAFDPAELTIETGTMVSFEWDSGGHNLVPREQPAGSQWDGVQEVQDAGYVHEHTFMNDGRVEYVCEPHEGQGMEGVIIVEE